MWTKHDIGPMGDGDESKPFGCSCWTHCELRRRIYENGREIVGLQCLRCGRWSVKPKTIAKSVTGLPLWDESLARSWQERMSKHREDIYQRQRAEVERDNREWWAKYDKYLKSETWKKKRALVLARSNGGCEACANAVATEVHHTTYAHVFDEPLFDLRAVCHGCHERLTARDRRNRGAQ